MSQLKKTMSKIKDTTSTSYNHLFFEFIKDSSMALNTLKLNIVNFTIRSKVKIYIK